MSGKNAIPIPRLLLWGDVAKALSASLIEVHRLTAGIGFCVAVQFRPASPTGHVIEPDLSTMKKRSSGTCSPARGSATHAASPSMMTPPPAPPAPPPPAPPPPPPAPPVPPAITIVVLVGL